MASEQVGVDDGPLEALSSVWVKMELDEEGNVEEDHDPEYTEDQEAEEAGDNSQESQEVQPVRRSRRKPAAPRKAKNVEERYFYCEHCDYKALHKSTLNYHMMKHTNPTPIPCTLCSYTTTHAASLRRHMLGVHTDVNDPIIQAMPDIKCKDCDFTCKFSWKLFIHRRKHDEKTFQCAQCDFATARKSNFEKHFRTHKHRDSGVYECDKCPFVTKHEGHISRHLAVIHKEVSSNASKCDYCEFSTIIKWRLNIHKKNSRQEKPIKCEFCDFITDYNCQYKLHKQDHLNDLAMFASGSECAKNVKSLDPTYKPSSANNTVSSTGEAIPLHDKEFIVDTACEEIDWRSIEVGEKPGLEKPFYCIQCPYTSKFKAAVQRHYQRNHTSENSKPYKCVNCSFSTKTRDQIALHNKRSKSNYQTCKVCDFATYYKCQMAEHQKVHWAFSCGLCDFVCKLKYDLNQHHTVVHLGQGWKCRYCDFQAARKGSLLNHESAHTNKRFKCGLCEYSATRRNLLFNHMKRCHAGEKPKIIINDRKFELKKVYDEQYENVVSKIIEHVNNVGSGMGFESGKSFQSDVSFDSDDVESGMKGESGKNVESGVKGERGKNVESDIITKSEFKSEDTDPMKLETTSVESKNQLKNNVLKVESENKFHTQVYIQRQIVYESDEDVEYESGNMFEDGTQTQRNVRDVGSRQDAYYSLAGTSN